MHAMPHAPGRKLALFSHVLPPSPSGQAAVIGRLLSGLPDDACCLLSCRDYAGLQAGPAGCGPLPARHHHLVDLPGRPGLRRLLPTRFRFPAEADRAIRERATRIGEILRSERAGVLVACTGELYGLPAAAAACRQTGIPFVPYLFDDYLHQWVGIERAVAARYEPGVIRGAAAVIVPNAAARDAYRDRYGVEATVIGNPCELPDLDALDALPRRFGSGDRAIVYAGSVYHAHFDAFRNLIEAMRRLARPGLKLHVFTDQTGEKLAQGGVCGPMVVRHDHVPPTEVPAILRQADVLFLPLAFDSPIPEVIRTSAPGKMGEYLSVARPVLVHAPADAFVGRYFRENGCGTVVDRDDPAELADALRGLLDGEGGGAFEAAARAAAERDFGVEEMRGRFFGLIDSVRRTE